MFCAEIREELAPLGPTERFLAKLISENMFRLERARAIENGISADGYREHVGGVESGHPEGRYSPLRIANVFGTCAEISLISTYEGKLRRAVDRIKPSSKAARRRVKPRETLARRKSMGNFHHLFPLGALRVAFARQLGLGAPSGGWRGARPTVDIHDRVLRCKPGYSIQNNLDGK
jgi:hypothetical protein